ncbi:MAG: ferric reductase, partial [Planktotalea sp.]
MKNEEKSTRDVLIWIGVACLIAAAMGAAMLSPLLAWRQPVYIVAGFAGIIAMALLLVQPLLASRSLLSLSPLTKRRLHRGVGAGLFVAVLV